MSDDIAPRLQAYLAEKLKAPDLTVANLARIPGGASRASMVADFACRVPDLYSIFEEHACMWSGSASPVSPITEAVFQAWPFPSAFR